MGRGQIGEVKFGVNPHTAGMLVVDLQQGFVNLHTEAVVPAVVRLAESWRSVGGSVMLTKFHNAPGSPYELITGWTRLRTEEEQALVSGLAPFVCGHNVIEKAGSSAFTPEGTRLIGETGWTDLVICGIDTDACVYDTAIAAYHNGIRPWIVTDACASSGGPQYHEAALLMAGRNIGRRQLVTSEFVLTQIGGGRERGVV